MTFDSSDRLLFSGVATLSNPWIPGIARITTSGLIDTSWGISGTIPYIFVGGVDGQTDFVKSTLFYNDKIFIFGNTVTEVNSTLYYKIFIHYTDQ